MISHAIICNLIVMPIKQYVIRIQTQMHKIVATYYLLDWKITLKGIIKIKQELAVIEITIHGCDSALSWCAE